MIRAKDKRKVVLLHTKGGEKIVRPLPKDFAVQLGAVWMEGDMECIIIGFGRLSIKRNLVLTETLPEFELSKLR